MRSILKFIALVITSAVLFSSCSTSNDVVSKSLLSKRKYRKGFHVNLKSNKVKPSARISAEELNIEKEEFAQKQEPKADQPVASKKKTVQDVKPSKPMKTGGFAQNIQTLKKLRKLTKEIKSMSREDLMASIDQIENQPNPAPGGSSDSANIFAILSLVGVFFMLVGIVIPFVGFLGWVMALVFGFLGLKSEKFKWMAVLALVLGFLFLLLFLIAVVLIVAILGGEGFI